MAQIVCPLVSAEDRARFEAIVADRRAQKHVLRARIILASADRPTARSSVAAWRATAIRSSSAS